MTSPARRYGSKRPASLLGLCVDQVTSDPKEQPVESLRQEEEEVPRYLFDETGLGPSVLQIHKPGDWDVSTWGATC